MNAPTIRPSLLILFSLAACPAPGQPLSLDRLELHSVKAEAVTYRGRTALRIADADSSGGDDVSRIAIVRDTSFLNGTIGVALTGDTAPDAPANLRGFVGIAFRLADAGSQYECIYLRPKNGRSEDQVQRNTQHNTFPFLDSLGKNSAQNTQANTSPMLIWCLANGRKSGYRCLGPRRGYT